MKRFQLLVFIFLVSEMAYAGPVMVANISNIRVRPYVTFIKLEGCARYSKIYLNTDYDKAMFSTALTAASAGKSVSVEFVELDGCETTESELVFLDVTY